MDTTVVPVTAQKNGGAFDFRYDSGAWFYAAEFDEPGTTMSIRGYNSYPIETFANFEFAPISGEEKFSVTINEEPAEFIQSVDEMGLWHIAFLIEPTSQMNLVISGFEEGLPPSLQAVPQWVKTNAGWWSSGKLPDAEFLKGLSFMIEKGIITPEQDGAGKESDQFVPSWVKSISEMWYSGKISDDDFVGAIAYLIDVGIVRV